MADQDDHEEAYGRGFIDGKRGGMLSDFVHSVKHVIPGSNPTTAQSYDAGYEEGAKRRHEIEPSPPSSEPKKDRPARREKPFTESSKSGGGDDGAPGCTGCLMVSLLGAAICILVLTTGWGPPFFDHLMLIFFAVSALVSYMGYKLQTSTTNEKIAFVVSVVGGLGLWYISVKPFTAWMFRVVYPNGPSANDDRFLKGLGPFWVCLVTPTLAVFVAWCCTSLLVRLLSRRR